MAITLTADELARAVNGGDQWDAAEKTRMLELATAVYAAEGLKHETPDALSKRIRDPSCGVPLSIARFPRAVGSRHSLSRARSWTGERSARARFGLSEIRGVGCFNFIKTGGRRGVLVSNLARREPTNRIY